MGSFSSALAVYTNPRVIAIFFLGFSSGLPLALTAGTLDIWLTREGLSLKSIGLFALVAIPYSLKFLWAPLIDNLNIPFFSEKFGRRRSWMVVTQIALMLSIIGLAKSAPSANIMLTAIFALLVAFSSASQDIVIDAFRVESMEENQQGAGAASVIFGYRIGMLISGAGALYLVQVYGLSWADVYLVMAGFILVGMATVFVVGEPAPKQLLETYEKKKKAKNRKEKISLWLKKAVIAPFEDFMKKPGWVVIIAFIVLYKLSDALAGKMTSPFLIKTGFTEVEIANIVKVYGFFATLIGTFLGGVIVHRYGLIKSLWIGAIIQMVSNLMFSVQAHVGHDTSLLALVIGIENLTGGIGSIIFVAYISSLCSISFTATQYALLSSLAVTGRTTISAYSGYMAEFMGWFNYFAFTALAAIPSLILLYHISKKYVPVFKEPGFKHD